MNFAAVSLIGFSACVLALGCAQCPDSPEPGDHPYAGTSAGCGNPPRLANMDLSGVNDCTGLECASGTIGPTQFRIGLGKELSIEFRYPPDAENPKARIYVFAADQIPVFQKIPLDSFDLDTRNGITLDPADLENAIRNATYKVTNLFVFTLHVVLFPVASAPDRQEGLLALLALDVPSATFLSNDMPTWGPDSIGEILAPFRYFQGNVVKEGSEVELPTAGDAFVFIPGSPFSSRLDLQNMQFRLDGLTNSAFELRMIVLPAEAPVDRKIPVYLLEAAPASDSGRAFRIVKTEDTAVIPGEFP